MVPSSQPSAQPSVHPSAQPPIDPAQLSAKHATKQSCRKSNHPCSLQDSLLSSRLVNTSYPSAQPSKRLQRYPERDFQLRAGVATASTTNAAIMWANSFGDVMCGKCPPGRAWSWLPSISVCSCNESFLVKWSSSPASKLQHQICCHEINIDWDDKI